MKILVVYYSETGNTERVAQAIHDEASLEHDVDLRKIKDIDVEDLNEYDLVFLGSACHSGDLAPPVKTLLDAIPESPKYYLAGFFTHSTLKADDDWFPHAGELFERWAGRSNKSFERLMEKGVGFKGCFNCMGAPSPQIEEFIHRRIIPDDEEFVRYMEEARKHPTIEDLAKARDFAREVLLKA